MKAVFATTRMLLLFVLSGLGILRVDAETVPALDKAIQKGVIHENTASRYKSRLSARVNALK